VLERCDDDTNLQFPLRGLCGEKGRLYKHLPFRPSSSVPFSRYSLLSAKRRSKPIDIGLDFKISDKYGLGKFWS
jgi:hypothetical protein